MKKYLFDSYALLCWLQEEKGSEAIDRLIKDSQEGKVKISMSIINLGEVYYRIAKVTDIETADDILRQIKFLPIEIISVRDQLVMKAAQMKARYPLAYADAFALATAIELKEAIVTGDPEFSSVEKKFEIVWIN